MGKHTYRLTEIKVRAEKRCGLHNDGDGLNLKVTNVGSKSWILRFKLSKRPFSMGLGAYPAVTLADARRAADEARALIRSGVNPIEERKACRAAAAEPLRAVTFEDAADRYIAAHGSRWRNEKHRNQWKATLQTYAYPAIGQKAIPEVALEDILKILEPIWTEKNETASRLRGRIENILDWAAVRKLRTGENPARWRGHLKHLLPARKKKRSVRHHPAMDWREVPEFLRELRANGSISARALELTLLTAKRTSEVIVATWHEIDFEEACWTIPPERIKTDVLHRVPLTKAAAGLLRNLPRAEGNRYIFPGKKRGQPLSNMAMLELLRGMRPGLTVHGFRSSFRDWVAEATKFPRELAEVALAHVVGNEVERAYQRGDLFEKRRKLMQAWEDYCGRDVSGRVVAMPVRASA